MVNMSSLFRYPNLEPVEEPRFLADFSDKDLEKIYAIGEVQIFAAGDFAVVEMTSSDKALYIILEGSVEVLTPKKNGWFKLVTLNPGAVFGELSFFDRQPRSARVLALIDCKVLKISESAFQRLRVHDTSVALDFIQDLGKILSYRLRHMNDLIQTFVT